MDLPQLRGAAALAFDDLEAHVQALSVQALTALSSLQTAALQTAALTALTALNSLQTARGAVRGQLVSRAAWDVENATGGGVAASILTPHEQIEL